MSVVYLIFIILSKVVEEEEEAVPLLMDIQSLDSPEPGKEEANPAVTDEVLPGTPEEQTTSMIVAGVLGVLEPLEEVKELESADDREGPNNIPVWG